LFSWISPSDMKRFSKKSSGKLDPSDRLQEQEEAASSGRVAVSSVHLFDDTAISSSTATPNSKVQGDAHLNASQDSADQKRPRDLAMDAKRHQTNEVLTSSGRGDQARVLLPGSECSQAASSRKFHRCLEGGSSSKSAALRFQRQPSAAVCVELAEADPAAPPSSLPPAAFAASMMPKPTLSSRRLESHNHTQLYLKQLSENRAFESSTRALTSAELSRLQEQVGRVFEGYRRAAQTAQARQRQEDAITLAERLVSSRSVSENGRKSTRTSVVERSSALRTASSAAASIEHRQSHPTAPLSRSRSSDSAKQQSQHLKFNAARAPSPSTSERSGAKPMHAVLAAAVGTALDVPGTASGPQQLPSAGRRSVSAEPLPRSYCDPTIAIAMTRLPSCRAPPSYADAAAQGNAKDNRVRRDRSPVGIPGKASLLPAQQKARPTFRTRSPPSHAIILVAPDPSSSAETLTVSAASTPDAKQRRESGSNCAVEAGPTAGAAQHPSPSAGGVAKVASSWRSPREVEIYENSAATRNPLGGDHHHFAAMAEAEHRRSQRAHEAAVSSARRSLFADADGGQPRSPFVGYTPPAPIASLCARARMQQSASSAASSSALSSSARRLIVQCVPEISTQLFPTPGPSY
jgi:hypothetical protein